MSDSSPDSLGSVISPAHVLRRGCFWAVIGVASATGLFQMARGYVDKGQASLLYLPVVIACASRFGFGPAVLGALLSFLCWNYFFLPPIGTFVIHDPKDWLSLVIFLVAAIATARLAARARTQAEEAQRREAETSALQQASEQITAEVDIGKILPALARQLVALCGAAYCVLFRIRDGADANLEIAAFVGSDGKSFSKRNLADWMSLARSAYDHWQPIGLGARPELWRKAIQDVSAPESDRRSDSIDHTAGIYIPLIADGQRWGVLHLGARPDGRAYSPQDERLILTLSNHAAVAMARQAAGETAAQVKALQEADALKTDLLSLVSHELRTPLAAIKASASGMLQSSAHSDEAVRETLEAINSESDRLNELVGKLLDLSRLDAGAWKPSFDWCDMVDVTGIALARLPEQDADRVAVICASDLPLVRADTQQISQVFTNLLENALKYAPDTTPVTITLSAQETDLQIDVADCGPGIPPKESEAIFERFYRRPAHRSQGAPGTGLGLAICRGIIQAHGGKIRQYNAPSGGAVFSFTLPLPVQKHDD